VDLGHAQAPLAQLPDWPAAYSVAGQVVQRIHVLREGSSFMVGSLKILVGQHLLELDELDSISRCSRISACWIKRLAGRFPGAGRRVDRRHHGFELRQQIILLFLRQVFEIFGKFFAICSWR
jgi:hypothetical protein